MTRPRQPRAWAEVRAQEAAASEGAPSRAAPGAARAPAPPAARWMPQERPDEAAASAAARAAPASDRAAARGATAGQGSAAAEGTADAAAPGCELEAERDGVARQLQRVQTQMQELLQLAKGSMEQYHVQLQALQLQATEARMLNSEEKLEKALKQHHKVMADQKRQEDQACSTMHTMRRREEELSQRKRLLDAQLAAKVRVRVRVRVTLTLTLT